MMIMMIMWLLFRSSCSKVSIKQNTNAHALQDTFLLLPAMAIQTNTWLGFSPTVIGLFLSFPTKLPTR